MAQAFEQIWSRISARLNTEHGYAHLDSGDKEYARERISRGYTEGEAYASLLHHIQREDGE